MTQDILAGKPFDVRYGDCLEVMRSLPSGCVDVALTSPPYVDCRLYGTLGFKLKGQAWVDWMVPRVVEACRVTAGLVFVNMAGKVKDFSYGPVVEWLVADLTRQYGIVCGPAPYAFRRVGIPGSGSKHYHRRDWEPVYGFALPSNLPPRWSANTAMGHPPKWAPGGDMSNRLADGSRVNQWGHSLESGATVQETPGGAVRSKGKRPSHVEASRNAYGFTPHEGEPSPGDRAKGKRRKSKRLERGNEKGSIVGPFRSGRPSLETADRTRTKTMPNGEKIEQCYSVPVLANPGNVIQEKYTAQEVAEILQAHGLPGDVIDTIVGGGVMGSKLAHENEAPFPVTLAEWFVRSYCPPGGIVLDFFAGSGTVIQAAIKHGRRALAIEIRDDMVELCYARGEEALTAKGE